MPVQQNLIPHEPPLLIMVRIMPLDELASWMAAKRIRDSASSDNPQTEAVFFLGRVPRKRVLLNQLAFLLLALLCAAAMWSYWKHLTGEAHGQTATTDALRPRPLSDLYPRWYGTRELFLHHRDPYGMEVSRELQIAFYGRVLDASRPGEPRDQQRFAYPLYVVFILAPFIQLDFHTVQVIFWWLLVAATLGSVLAWQRFLSLSFSWTAWGTLAAVLLGSIGVIQGLGILQLGLLVSCFISAAAACLISGHLFLAGALLALSTIKPQLAALPLAWFALWAIADWRNRRSLLGGFGATLGALVVGSEYLVPGWLWRYPRSLRAYANYTGASSLLGTLFPSPLHWPVAILAFLIAARFCWHSRRQAAHCVSFAISLSFALTLTVSIVPTVVGPFNHILLLPVVLLLVRHWNELWVANALTRFSMVVFCGCASLPWILAFIVAVVPSSTAGSWPLYLWLAPLCASLALPIAAFSMLIQMRRLEYSPCRLME